MTVRPNTNCSNPAVVVALATAVAVLTFAVKADASVSDAARAISAWQMAEAKTFLDQAERDGDTGADYLLQRGREAYFLGRYKEALDYFDQALANTTDASTVHRITVLRERVQKTYEVTKDYLEVTSPGGYVKIRMEPGKDEVLLPYAFETLDRAYEAIGSDLQYKPPAPVLVEIYPRPATLAAVSGLTEDEIKTSGTIALCSYNRLMFTSPKAMVRGYAWRDTLSHEFVHLVITQKTRNRVPIWMHEGLAKFEERRWRGPGVHLISPSSENFLAKAVKTGELITFEQMHPSMAKLPSQEATSLAFSEVYTVMEYIQSRKGPDALATMLDSVRDTSDAQKAVELLMGVPFARFEQDWKRYLKTRPSQAFDEDAVVVSRIQFKGEKKESDLLTIGKKEARDYVHLGELLQKRERYGAAVLEYQKAHRLLGNRNPILQTRLGRSLIELHRFDEAAHALAGSLKFYPEFHSTHALLGEALFRGGHLPEAEKELIEAVGINPFDPRPHELLASLYKDTDRPKLAARSRDAANKVR